MKPIITYFICFFSMLAIDTIWLTTVVKRLYKPLIGTLLSPQPALFPALIFYLLYAFGIQFFVISPAIQREWDNIMIFFIGSFFGLVAYGTYDLTNQATLAYWPWLITIIDMAWGGFVTGITSLITVWAYKLIFK